MYQSLPSIWCHPPVSPAGIYLPWQGTYIVSGMVKFSTADTILVSVIWDGSMLLQLLVLLLPQRTALASGIMLLRCNAKTIVSFCRSETQTVKCNSAALETLPGLPGRRMGCTKDPDSAAALASQSPEAVDLNTVRAHGWHWYQVKVLYLISCSHLKFGHVMVSWTRSTLLHQGISHYKLLVELRSENDAFLLNMLSFLFFT